MSKPDSLEALYADEMKDLWSANNQMTRAVQTLGKAAHDPKLVTLLRDSVQGIEKHTASIKELIRDSSDEVEPEHCRGMEGLVQEALKHGIEEAPDAPELQDIAIITQYQRMSHYGITGFGSVSALAEALGKTEHVRVLKGIVSDIYKADEYSSHLGETAARLALQHAS